MGMRKGLMSFCRHVYRWNFAGNVVMNKISIQIGNRRRDINIPESWNDLDLRTLVTFYETIFTNIGDEFTSPIFTSVKLISMTQHILGVDMAFMAKWEADCIRQDAENGSLVFLSELADVIDMAVSGLFDKNEDENGGHSYAVKFNLTKNPYPSLGHTPKSKGKRPKKTTWYFAPADGLDNITIYEMAYSFQLYEAYVRTREEKYAMELIGCIYRPSRPVTREETDAGWFGDRRQPLRRRETKIEERAKMADTLPTVAKRLILFWFASCREKIIKAWPQVFKESDAGGSVSNNQWGDFLLSLAETGVFGNLDQTADQHYSNALQLMTKRDNDARELEKKKKK